MNKPEPMRINLDPTNPGQFFACCGLLELAGRLWPGAEGWFTDGAFCIASPGTLHTLVGKTSGAKLTQLEPDDDMASPIELGDPFRPLRLDWWQDERAGGKALKVWAGSMEGFRIARAMQHALREEVFRTHLLFDIGVIVYDPDNAGKKVEPFYFDARRGPNAHSRDVGFSPNDIHLTTTAFPAVEFLCLVGLQRSLPVQTKQPRVFDYFTWTRPVEPMLVPAAVSGHLNHVGQRQFRFENWYRTGQRKHKAFRSAVLLS